MSFLNQSKIVTDESLILRVAACAAIRGVANPEGIVRAKMWEFSAQPGWGTAYESSTVEPPGADETAITDTMIQTAVDEVFTDDDL